MFKVNRKIEYALIALKHMSHNYPGKLTSAKEICDTYHLPFDPTSRVLQIMAQHGIVKAEYGAYGGYQIIKDLSKISFSDLTDMIVGPIEIVQCFHRNFSQCGLTGSCNVISPMLNLNEKMLQLFKTITIKELLDSKNNDEKTIKSKPIEKVSV